MQRIVVHRRTAQGTRSAACTGTDRTGERQQRAAHEM